MLHNKFKNKNIILASGSPRRQELFKELGVNYSIKVKEVDEIYDSTLKKEEITNYLAELKANAFSNEIGNNDIIITADTIVWQNNKALENGEETWETEIDGSTWSQKTFNYQGKCLQWINQEFYALTDIDQKRLMDLFEGTGCEKLLMKKN